MIIFLQFHKISKKHAGLSTLRGSVDRLDSTHGKRKVVDITIIRTIVITIIVPIIITIIRTIFSWFLMSATPF